ncbi:hypothetical protein DRJ25_01520 [Candidatus Woesearchaeota archaeon]|nr:MAG: hypothetical protein DRJ25_01520 [Candidatus Woesearchaeota archaeon]
MPNNKQLEKDLERWKGYFNKFRERHNSFKTITDGKNFGLKEITDKEHTILLTKGIIKEIQTTYKPIDGNFKPLVHALSGAYTISNFYDEIEKIKQDFAEQSSPGITTKKHLPELLTLEKKIQDTFKRVRKRFGMEETFEKGGQIALEKLGIRCTQELTNFQIIEENLQAYLPTKKIINKETIKDPYYKIIIRELWNIQEQSRRGEITTEEYLKQTLLKERELYINITRMTKTQIDKEVKTIEEELREKNLLPTFAGAKYVLGGTYEPEKIKTEDELTSLLIESRGITNRIKYELSKQKKDKKTIHSQATIGEEDYNQETQNTDASEIAIIIAKQGAEFAAKYVMSILELGDKYRKEIHKMEKVIYKRIKNPAREIKNLRKGMIEKAEKEAKEIRKTFEEEIIEYMKAYEKNINHPFYIGLFEVLKSYGMRDLIGTIGERVTGDIYRTETLNLNLRETMSLKFKPNDEKEKGQGI